LGGGVDDTDNNQRAGYIQAQAEFQSNVAVNGRITPFTIILDNRYPGRAAGWDNGYQIALQPPAAKSDRPVTANLENLSSYEKWFLSLDDRSCHLKTNHILS
jgi:hypothetical protein